MNDIQVGQMMQLSHEVEGEDSWWEYIVANKVFDDRVEFTREHGGRFMWSVKRDESEELTKNDKTNFRVFPLKKDGKIVFSKKVFGKYTFEPKN